MHCSYGFLSMLSWVIIFLIKCFLTNAAMPDTSRRRVMLGLSVKSFVYVLFFLKSFVYILKVE
jgi:hypothetical protein